MGGCRAISWAVACATAKIAPAMVSKAIDGRCTVRAGMPTYDSRLESIRGATVFLAKTRRQTQPPAVIILCWCIWNVGAQASSEDLAEELFHPISDPGLFSLAVAGHVQRPDLVLGDPRRDVRDGCERRRPGRPAGTACRTVDTPRPSPERPRSSSRRTKGSRRSLGRSVRSERVLLSVGISARGVSFGELGVGPVFGRENPSGIQPPRRDAERLGGPPRRPGRAPVWPPLMILVEHD